MSISQITYVPPGTSGKPAETTRMLAKHRASGGQMVEGRYDNAGQLHFYMEPQVQNAHGAQPPSTSQRQKHMS